MTEEEIRKIINDTFDENIMNNLDSSIIFKYIEGLEKENQKYKEAIDRAKKRIEKGIYIIPKDTNEILDILKEVE